MPSKHDLPTPALLLDLDGFEANVWKMARHAAASGVALRPHAKTHKCAEIARLLIGAGAVGACAAKISEAEVLAANGVTGVLLTSAMIGRQRIEGAIRLARSRPETIFSVDDSQNVSDLNDAAAAAGVRLNLAIDLLVGTRTGIEPGQPALRLAQWIDSLGSVRLHGIQAYANNASHVTGFDARRLASELAMGRAVETRRLIEQSGIECAWLSGGSTGTYSVDTAIPGVTEIQPGSYLFMDIEYSRIGGEDGGEYRDFADALFVVATVISKPSARIAIVDAGFKCFATDKPFCPETRLESGIVFSWAGDEHGRLHLENATAAVKVGDRIEFRVPHCDPTVNLHDRIYCIRGERVEAEWPIVARGKSQ